MNQPTYKAPIKSSYFSQFFKRFYRGLLRDFFRGGIAFLFLFVLMLLHLTQTIEIAPLKWLMSSQQAVNPQLALSSTQEEAQSKNDTLRTDATASGSEIQRSDTVPNLLP